MEELVWTSKMQSSIQIVILWSLDPRFGSDKESKWRSRDPLFGKVWNTALTHLQQVQTKMLSSLLCSVLRGESTPIVYYWSVFCWNVLYCHLLGLSQEQSCSVTFTLQKSGALTVVSSISLTPSLSPLLRLCLKSGDQISNACILQIKKGFPPPQIFCSDELFVFLLVVV